VFGREKLHTLHNYITTINVFHQWNSDTLKHIHNHICREWMPNIRNHCLDSPSSATREFELHKLSITRVSRE